MQLKDLLEYEDIVIQCHDNPDADTVASGFAVYCFLKQNGKKPRLIYGGRNLIRKTNLLMMIRDFQIPIEHVQKLNTPELLVMVDCQYQGGNTEVFRAGTVAVLDHHRVCTDLPPLSNVRSNLGSCSTLLWKMLKDEGIDVAQDKDLSTVLYFGLYTDTNGFAEIAHPLDRDLRDEAKFDTILMTKYRNANLALDDLQVAGAALLQCDYLDEYRAAVVKAAPCDPNILGIISDMVLEVDVVDVCLVFNVQQTGVKFSVRSCIKEVKASELAEEISKGIGSGGGHMVKAGGFIQMALLTEEYLEYCKSRRVTPRMEPDAEGAREQPVASGIKILLEKRLKEYMDNTEIAYVGDCKLDGKNSRCYCRKPIPWGYVRATDCFPKGTKVTVRSIQGDIDMEIEKDIIFVISPLGVVFYRKEEEFCHQFRTYPDWKFALHDSEYAPTIKEEGTGNVKTPVDSAKVCVPKQKQMIQARELKNKLKLFREEDKAQQYSFGQVGDYLMDSSDAVNGIRIMKKEMFEAMYDNMEQAEEIKTVIFDLDGTLLDTLEDLKDAVNAALFSLDMPLCTLEQVRQYVGNGVKKLMIRAVPGGEENPQFEQAFQAFKDYYGKHCLDYTKPYPDVLYLLEELHARGVRTAIVSNKLDSAVKELNERFFKGYITVAIGEMEGVARKPKPDMVLKALEELGVDRSTAVYVGDSEVDIQTAENTGLPCISVIWGFREEVFLRTHGAKTTIQTPLELLYLI